ncbi:SIR2 family NAD-dependent protein deacylase [Fictibacillus barbaricus]|uniref:NAD-dependent SIR2 family protein deacetylase n=1 Tax=Fictibacillus barbaricus TaxID=182136 RepID=A0ABU1U5K9_9BACL|nr:SIR2 family protein [Fictibacillus barbaricus]MDR7074683.1 NAD-dependent SIR2 family protein deacetylase [Fictibacillus barbaricus]
MNINRDIDDVIVSLKNAKREGIKVNLLIGAGCSATADIPTANGIVKLIKEKFPREYERANPKSYENCMSKLTPSERRNLIKSLVDDAKINWAHIAIAQLIKHNFFHRVLTTNFDNLLQRACALVGEFPGIYDLTTSSEFRSDLLFEKSIIHLHGQHTGFILCNTKDELEEQLNIINPVFKQLNQNSLWLIVGYSGKNDPIFNLLSEQKLFENRLFWVGYRYDEPEMHLKENLLSEEKYAFYVSGHTSDDFFIELAQNLDCFPPTFIQKPFTYLYSTLNNITEYSEPGYRNRFKDDKDSNINGNIQVSTKNFINKAIYEIESDPKLMADHYLMAGLYDEVLEFDKKSENDFELEINIIQALKAKSILHKETNIITEAKDRAESLISRYPDDPQLYTLLGEIHYETFLMKSRVELKEQFLDLISSLDAMIYSMELSPSMKKLKDIYYITYMLFRDYNDQKLNTNNQNAKDDFNKGDLDKCLSTCLDLLKQYFKQFTTFNETLDGLYINLTYELVAAEDYENARKYLTFYNEVKEYLNPHDVPFIDANWGYWYFNNNTLEFSEAEEKGKYFYSIAFEQLSVNDPQNSDLLNAFKQKYYLEHSKFYLRYEMIQEATDMLIEAKNLGELRYSFLYNECKELAIEIKSKLDLKNQEVASALDIDEESN